MIQKPCVLTNTVVKEVAFFVRRIFLENLFLFHLDIYHGHGHGKPLPNSRSLRKLMKTIFSLLKLMTRVDLICFKKVSILTFFSLNVGDIG